MLFIMRNYKELIGMTKNEVLFELGDQLNFFQSDVWTYEIEGRNWWGMKVILFIFFEDEIVSYVKIKRTFNNHL